jgi:hypothetical protein
VDTPSVALGGAVHWAQAELLPIAIWAPADRKTRDLWLDRLWQGIEDDYVDFLSLVGNQWGDLCGSREVASCGGGTYFSACSALLGPIPGSPWR